MERWRKYFRDLMKAGEVVRKELPSSSELTIGVLRGGLYSAIEKEEGKSFIYVKGGKAAGQDGIAVEFLKCKVKI